MKWYIKDMTTGMYLLRTNTRWTIQKYEDGSPDWKYHSKDICFSRSKLEAQKFDKEKNAIQFARKHFELKKMMDANNITFVEEI